MPLHLANPPTTTSALPKGISRRAFLAVCAAGCAKSLQPTVPQTDDWALLADTHIQADPKATAWDTCMAENLDRAIREIADLDPRHILFNGDVAFRAGEPPAYSQFLKAVDRLPKTGQLLHFTLGNHDHRANFLAAIPAPRDSNLDSKLVTTTNGKNARYLFLDTLDKVNAIAGALGDAQRSWLVAQLNAAPNDPTILMLHHNPDLSLSGLTDSPAFLQIVRAHRQVKALIYGHTHEFRIANLDGVHLINLPAVGYRFNPKEPLGWVEAHISPGGAEIELHCLTGDSPSCRTRRKLPWRSNRAT